MRLRHPDTFIKYVDDNSVRNQVWNDALSAPEFRKYILVKAQPIWNPLIKTK